jgi:hypothetical protein
VTGCDFLWAVCGVVGAVCRAVCGVRAAVWCAQRCACGDDCAVRSDWCCAGRPAGGLCVCMLRASVRCGVRGLWAFAVLGDTRHDADVPLWWLTFVASCVSARACLWCDGVGERGASRHVRGVAVCLRKCEESWLRHTRDVALPALSRAQ